MKKPVHHIYLLFLLLAIPASYLSGQEVINRFEFLAPVPGALYVPPATSIILRPGDRVRSSLNELADLISVTGNVSGRHSGTIVIADDGETIIFSPDKPFAYSEQVLVHISEGIEMQQGVRTEALSYDFRISQAPRGTSSSIFEEFRDHMQAVREDQPEDKQLSDVTEKERRSTLAGPTDVFVPGDYPKFDMTIGDRQGDGDIFIAPVSFSGRGTPYLLILDSKGDPVFYRRLPFSALDFKKQHTGQLSYFNSGPGDYVVMDSSYKTVNTWKMQNGYLTDGHGLQLLPDGHALMMCYDAQPVDMSTVVSGGDPDAIVTGLVIQELDSSKNVVFEWRSWDYFNITDAVGDVDLKAKKIDYVHANALERDQDGNILLSSRHLDEITKIDRNTGEIIWRLGGENNQFTFVNDTVGFSHQHDIRRLPNGHITLFDNGNLHSPLFSRAVEYELDEVNRKATLVWKYPEGTERYSFAMGSVQRLPGGNTMIGWGFPLAGERKIVATEVTPDKNIEFEIEMDTSIVSYRAFRFSWDGHSAAPYLWIEDRDHTTIDTVLLKMTIFGREDVVKYHLWRWDYPSPERLFDSTEGHTLVVRNLERGKSYLFKAIGVTDQGEETEASDWIRFTILPIGPIFVPPGFAFNLPVTKVGTTRSHTIAGFFNNTGEEPLIIEEMVPGGANSQEFSIGGGINFPLTVLPGTAVDLVIDFTPSVEGARDVEFTVKSNAVNEPERLVRFGGTGTRALIAGKDIRFPKTSVGTQVDSMMVNVIANTGIVPLEISEITIASDEFELVSFPSLPFTLPAQDSLGLTIAFTPQDSGERRGVLKVVSDGEPNPLEIFLSGRGDKIGSGVNEEETSLQISVSYRPQDHVITIRSPISGKATISIIDMQGKAIYHSESDVHEGKERLIQWDGMDNQGERISAGKYLLEVIIGANRRVIPFFLLQ